MSTWIHTSALVGAIIFGCIFLVSADQGSYMVDSKRVEFVRGPSQEARSPNGVASIVLSAPANEDADPRMEAVAGNQRRELGPLRRSAFVYWRPDGNAVALWDLSYSNDYRVRVVRTKPLLEVKGINSLIKDTVLREFHPAELVHYWPYVEGWTRQNELAVLVCADGTPPNSQANTRLMGFEKGYLVDVDKVRITAEFPQSEFLEKVGADPCK